MPASFAMALAASRSHASSCVEVGAQVGAHRFDALHRRLHRGALRAAFAGERDERRRIAQGRAIVLAADQDRAAKPARSLQCGGVDAFGARAIAGHGERRGDLRLGDRRRQRIELGIGEVAKVADRRDAVARQHIERIGEIGAAVLTRVGRVGDHVAQPVEREPERGLGHRDLALARAGKEIRDVGIEPDVIAADAPQAERAVGILARQQRLRWRRGFSDRSPDRAAICESLARSLR